MDRIEPGGMDHHHYNDSQSQAQYPEPHQTRTFAWSGQILEDTGEVDDSSSVGGLQTQYYSNSASQIYDFERHASADESRRHLEQAFNPHDSSHLEFESSFQTENSYPAKQFPLRDDQYTDGPIE